MHTRSFLALAASKQHIFALPENSTSVCSKGLGQSGEPHVLCKRIALSHQPLVIRRDALAERASAVRGRSSGQDDM